jgi:integrase
MTRETPSRRIDLQGIWEPTNVQFLYRHRNGRYYVRTYALGKEKWTSLRTNLLSTARNRMKEHLEAAERLRAENSDTTTSVGPMTFADALTQCRRELKVSPVRPATKAFREAGFKKLLATWTGVEALNVRRITPKDVIDWLRKLVAEARPHVPNNARRAAHNSTGASLTTVKCALDSLRLALDVAVESGHLAINPARTRKVTLDFSRMTRILKRRRAERGRNDIPTREDFQAVVSAVRSAGVSDCRACADHIEFLAYSGARKNEAANVCWGDVDFRRGQIVLRVTKNGEARMVPMISEMRLLLERLVKERGEEPREADVLDPTPATGHNGM